MFIDRIYFSTHHSWSRKPQPGVLFRVIGKIIIDSLSLMVERKTVSDFYWLKTLYVTSVSPVTDYAVSHLNGSRGPGSCLTVGKVSGPSLCADSSLAFSKEVGSNSRVTPSLVRLHSHVWWADTSRSELRPPPHGVNPRVPLGLESHYRPIGL